MVQGTHCFHDVTFSTFICVTIYAYRSFSLRFSGDDVGSRVLDVAGLSLRLCMLWTLAVYDGDRSDILYLVSTVLSTTVCTQCTGGYVLSGVCPSLCHANGEYQAGRCVCHAGWKGQECDVPHTHCEDPTCSGNGKCVDGTCLCAPGFRGVDCQHGKHLVSVNCIPRSPLTSLCCYVVRHRRWCCLGCKQRQYVTYEEVTILCLCVCVKVHVVMSVVVVVVVVITRVSLSLRILSVTLVCGIMLHLLNTLFALFFLILLCCSWFLFLQYIIVAAVFFILLWCQYFVTSWVCVRCVMWCWVVDCLSANCSGHGVCVHGECLCYRGYHGSDCSLSLIVADSTDSVLCVRDCSQHGVFAFSEQTCVCQMGWTGRNCETGRSSTSLT